MEIHSWCCAWLWKLTPTWCWPRVFTRFQRVPVFEANDKIWAKFYQFYAKLLQKLLTLPKKDGLIERVKSLTKKLLRKHYTINGLKSSLKKSLEKHRWIMTKRCPRLHQNLTEEWRSTFSEFWNFLIGFGDNTDLLWWNNVNNQFCQMTTRVSYQRGIRRPFKCTGNHTYWGLKNN